MGLAFGLTSFLRCFLLLPLLPELLVARAATEEQREGACVILHGVGAEHQLVAAASGWCL